MRLIDADALKKRLKILTADGYNKLYVAGIQAGIDFYFPQIIDDAPTITPSVKGIDQKTLDAITQYLINNIFRNPDYMFDTEHSEDVHSDLIDIIATLHNYLWESVTGEKYDYMRHWANKCGADCNDNFDMLGQQKGMVNKCQSDIN